MQGSGHIHSHCKYDDEYQYRYNYDVGVFQMDFYLSGMDVYILLVQSTEWYQTCLDIPIQSDEIQYVAHMFYVSLVDLWFNYDDQLWRILREKHKTHL
jgi:hypothetical protein